MPDPINSFHGPYRFLSNFWPCTIEADGGTIFPSVEHAFQAAKCKDRSRWPEFLLLTAGQAKRLGREVEMRPDWNDIRVEVMRRLLRKKFAEGSSLARRLLRTGDAELIEGNTWGDQFWGVCRGKGENWLGRLLMARRDELRQPGELPSRFHT